MNNQAKDGGSGAGLPRGGRGGLGGGGRGRGHGGQRFDPGNVNGRGRGRRGNGSGGRSQGRGSGFGRGNRSGRQGYRLYNGPGSDQPHAGSMNLYYGQGAVTGHASYSHYEHGLPGGDSYRRNNGWAAGYYESDADFDGLNEEQIRNILNHRKYGEQRNRSRRIKTLEKRSSLSKVDELELQDEYDDQVQYKEDLHAEKRRKKDHNGQSPQERFQPVSQFRSQTATLKIQERREERQERREERREQRQEVDQARERAYQRALEERRHERQERERAYQEERAHQWAVEQREQDRRGEDQRQEADQAREQELAHQWAFEQREQDRRGEGQRASGERQEERQEFVAVNSNSSTSCGLTHQSNSHGHFDDPRFECAFCHKFTDARSSLVHSRGSVCVPCAEDLESSQGPEKPSASRRGVARKDPPPGPPNDIRTDVPDLSPEDLPDVSILIPNKWEPIEVPVDQDVLLLNKKTGQTCLLSNCQHNVGYADKLHTKKKVSYRVVGRILVSQRPTEGTRWHPSVQDNARPEEAASLVGTLLITNKAFEKENASLRDKKDSAAEKHQRRIMRHKAEISTLKQALIKKDAELKEARLLVESSQLLLHPESSAGTIREQVSKSFTALIDNQTKLRKEQSDELLESQRVIGVLRLQLGASFAVIRNLHQFMVAQGLETQFKNTSEEELQRGLDGRPNLPPSKPPARRTSDQGTLIHVRESGAGSRKGDSKKRRLSV